MRRVLPLLAVLTVALPWRAGAQTVVELEGCHDGDTCTFDRWEASVRLEGIDAPELDGPCRPEAREARRALERTLEAARTIRVDSLGTGHYGRILGVLYADSLNVNDWLVRRGRAVPYGEETCPMPGDSAGRAGELMDRAAAGRRVPGSGPGDPGPTGSR